MDSVEFHDWPKTHLFELVDVNAAEPIIIGDFCCSVWHLNCSKLWPISMLHLGPTLVCGHHSQCPCQLHISPTHSHGLQIEPQTPWACFSSGMNGTAMLHRGGHPFQGLGFQQTAFSYQDSPAGPSEAGGRWPDELALAASRVENALRAANISSTGESPWKAWPTG
jgi:hypothetical protein